MSKSKINLKDWSSIQPESWTHKTHSNSTRSTSMSHKINKRKKLNLFYVWSSLILHHRHNIYHEYRQYPSSESFKWKSPLSRGWMPVLALKSTKMYKYSKSTLVKKILKQNGFLVLYLTQEIHLALLIPT